MKTGWPSVEDITVLPPALSHTLGQTLTPRRGMEPVRPAPNAVPGGGVRARLVRCEGILYEAGVTLQGYKGIGDYGLVGDCHSSALVAVDGSIDWCTFPRFDSPSVFAAILDAEKGGRFSITPSGPYTGRQRYVPDTNVLETEFVSKTGRCTLTDFMPLYRGQDGTPVANHQIVRILRCHEGAAQLRIVYEPRPNYARSVPRLFRQGHVLVVEDGEAALTLTSTVPLTEQGNRAVGGVFLSAGEEAVFVLSYESRSLARSQAVLPPGLLLQRTVAFWQEKVRNLDYWGAWRDEVTRSYLALHLLTYLPTGAIVAAPTTSLPEAIGGVRNWDYRYTWLRDAAFTIDALLRLQHREEALPFFRWVGEVCARYGEDLPIMFRVDGSVDLREQTLPHLEGYERSKPVRIGNGAFDQRQNDIYGEVLASADLLASSGEPITDAQWTLLRTLANLALARWQTGDSGIWEVRGGPAHFVYSRVMCWVALDRAVHLAEITNRRGPEVQGWRTAAEAIKEEVLAKGWSEQKQAFVQHYDAEALDASNLLIPLVGFLEADDPRVVSTVERIREELGHGPFLSRYRTDETDDGLPGDEGAFTLCSFWLVQVLARMGRTEEARRLFDELLTYSNHLGLFAEMVDTSTGTLLGNFPQAFTHIGLILAAYELGSAVDRSGKEGAAASR